MPCTRASIIFVRVMLTLAANIFVVRMRFTMPRGGSRSGRPSGNYSNRSDLQNSPRLAPTATKGQAYGEAGAQLASQSVIPMAPPPPPIPLSAPSTRANEPVQAGLSSGPGVGPESIPAIAPNQPNPDLIAFAPYLPALELMTSLPNTSTATRNFVRYLRASIPIDTPTTAT